MRFFAIVFAAIVIGTQGRSLALSKVKDAEEKSAACVDAHRSVRVHRNAGQDFPPATWIESSVSVNSVNSTDEKTPSNVPQRLKDLIALYEDNVAKLVEQARGMCENKSDNRRQINFQKVRNAYAMFGNVTDSALRLPSKAWTIENVNNLRNLLDTVRELDIVYQDGEITDEHIRIKRANKEYKGVASDREEQIVRMLFDIQRQLTHIRKYLDKLCKKYYPTRTTTEVNPINNVSLVDQPNKVPIIQY